MNTTNWFDKPYYSLDAYFKNTYGYKCYKIALNAHMTCPNRDGSLDTRGCIFCSVGGSGEYAAGFSPKQSVWQQLQKGMEAFHSKSVGELFVAYFQAYTNTYAPISYLECIYKKALDCEQVIGISIATRPDCLGDAVLALLKSLKEQYPQKFIWIELGLQTIHESTAAYIRRGYPLAVFEQAVKDLQQLGLLVIVHIIIGLPGESKEMLLDTISYLNAANIFGIKLQLLHVLSGTDLADDYAKGTFVLPTLEEYLSLVQACLEHLSPDIVIHRLTGDGPREQLIAPLWSLNKRNVLNRLHQNLRREQSRQGKFYIGGTHDCGTLDPL